MSNTPNILNFSPDFNCLALTPPKTGSRNLTRILNYFRFYSYNLVNDTLIFEKNEPTHNHTMFLMENHQAHEIILTCRNPYDIFVTFFKLKVLGKNTIRSKYDIKKEFNEYIFEYVLYNKDDPWQESNHNQCVKKLLERKIDYRIKLENFKDSVLQIPFISNDNQKLEQISKLCDEKFGDHTSLKEYEFAKTYFPSDFRLYYNQESADLVYQNFTNKFLIMDYHKDSWML